jgi:hypothetical protein
MSYSLMHNKDTSLMYSVYLNNELIVKNVAAHHVESVIYSLEAEGFNVADELWDEEALRVDIISTHVLDHETDDDHID